MSTTKPSRVCCGTPMYFEWGEPDSQWDQGYPTSWHCQECGSSELATSDEIRAMLEFEDEQFKLIVDRSAPGL